MWAIVGLKSQQSGHQQSEYKICVIQKEYNGLNWSLPMHRDMLIQLFDT